MSATYLPMVCCTGPMVGRPTSVIGVSSSTSAATCDTWMWHCPKANGTCGFTSSTMARALLMAAMV